MPTVLKSGSLNLLEPSGPVQACNGIALPFTAYHSQRGIPAIAVLISFDKIDYSEKIFENEVTYIRNFNPSSANVHNMVAPTNASKWQMGFNSAFKGLKEYRVSCHKFRVRRTIIIIIIIITNLKN